MLGKKKNNIMRVLLFGALLGSQLGHSEELEPTPYDLAPKKNRGLVSNAVDSVDPWSGNLKVSHIDLSIPGTAGMDINIHRSYDLQRLTAGLAAPYRQSTEWTALGPGWTIAAAPKIYHATNYHLRDRSGTPNYYMNSTFQLCNNKGERPSARFNLRLPDGSSEKFYRVAPYEDRTKSNWRLRCDSMVLTLTSPSGIRYDMGRADVDMKFSASVTSFPMEDPDFTESIFLTKKATDLNGNWIAYDYTQFGPPLSVPISGSVYIDHCLQTNLEDAANCEKSDMLLSRITSSDGRAVDFNYDPATGRLLSLVDNNQRMVQYGYTAKDHLNSQALAQVTGPTGEVWKYAYHPGEWFQIAVSNESYANDQRAAARKLISIEQPSGGKTTYEYSYVDLEGRLGGRFVWSRFERISRKIDAAGNHWAYAYNRGNIGQYDSTVITGPDGTTLHEFIGPGYSIATDGNTINNTVWSIGSPVKITRPDGSYETYKWQQRFISHGREYVFELGVVTDDTIWAADLQERTFVRDGATYSSHYSNYDAYGNPGILTETGPNSDGRTTTLTWYNNTDKWIIGRPIDQMSPDSSVHRIYDENGKLINYNRDGVATAYTYDAQGNQATQIRPGDRHYSYMNYKLGTPQTEVQPEGITISRAVDDAGNVTSETNGEGHTTHYEYDRLNRVTSITPPQGAGQKIIYTPTSKTTLRGNLSEIAQYDLSSRVSSIVRGDITTTYAYDAYGRVTFTSDPNSSMGTSYQYDALGRVIRITHADGTYQSTAYGFAHKVITDERGNSTTYNYRGYGDPEKLSLMSFQPSDPVASITLTRNGREQVTSVTQGNFTRHYGYNANGYLISVSNPETGDTVYGRDIAGNMTSKQVGQSDVTTYTYDGQNRQTAIDYAQGTPAIKNTYDKQNNLLIADSSTGIRSFTYNPAGFVITESLSIEGKLFELSYGYDENDRLKSLTYNPSGRIVEYAPDVLGRPTMVSGYVSNIAYWPNGMIKQVIYANGAAVSYEQNSRLWPASFNITSPAGVDYLKSMYDYDGAGNLLTIRDGVDNSMDRTLAYDSLDRLVSADGFWGVGTLAYDGVGNLTKKTFGDSSLNYNYDIQNRLTSVDGQRIDSINYDAYGNVSSSADNAYLYNNVPNLVCINCVSPDKKVEYQYDGLNQRSSVSSAGNKIYEMQDADGRLRMELEGDKLTEYFYLGDQRIAQQVSP
ncbi:hypothetical protein Q1J55_16645 [Pseudomonas syringae]